MDTSIGSKLLIGAVLLCGLLLAFVAGTAVSEENYFQLALILALIFGLAYLTVAGPRYWLLIPFALYSGLPAIPLGAGRSLELAELAMATCGVIFLANIALKRQRISFYRPLHVPLLIFISWVVLTWMMNPVGVVMFGAQTVGGRFYLKLALAFLSFLIMASQRPSEKDIYTLMAALAAASVITVLYGLWSYTRGTAPLSANISLEEDFYSWHQILAFPASVISLILFGRWKTSEVFTPRRWYLLLLYFVCLAVAVASGKRMGVMAILITPLAAAVYHKEFRMAFVALVVAGLFVAFVVLGHGQLFTLPKTAQRALSFLPAEWDESLKNMQGGSDMWREKIREYAWEIVKATPVITRGYALDLEELAGANYVSFTVGGGLENQVLWAVAGRSWHNTWLGYTADFGLPVTLAHAANWLVVLIAAFRLARIPGIPIAYRAFAGYVFIYTIRDVIASHTSGHTANDAFGRWWMYGLFFAVYYGAKSLVTEKAQIKAGAARTAAHPLAAGAVAGLGASRRGSL